MPTKNKPEGDRPEAINTIDIHTTRAADFRSIYANSARIHSSLYDFTLTFGRISSDGEKLELEESVQIMMSPQHAKVLLQILERNVNAYEEKFGTLTLPDGVA